MHRATISAVVFDFYFTLADPTVHAEATVAELLARHNSSHAADDVLTAWFGGDRRDLQRAFDGDIPAFTSFREHWGQHGGEHLVGFGLPRDSDGWADCRRDAHIRAVLYDDVVPVLGELRAGGLPVGVMSDADNDFLLGCLEANELQFDVVVSSEDLRCYKPHRYVFEAACERLGVATSDAIYVGDTPRADVEGARRAGMRTAWINRNGRKWPAELAPADFAIASLSELPELLF